MNVRIVRIKPRPGGTEEAWRYPDGYRLADPRLGTRFHHEENAIHVPTLEKAEGRDRLPNRGVARNQETQRVRD